jgi:hypothetical protein
MLRRQPRTDEPGVPSLEEPALPAPARATLARERPEPPCATPPGSPIESGVYPGIRCGRENPDPPIGPARRNHLVFNQRPGAATLGFASSTGCVLVRHQVRLDLRDEVHHHHHNDQQRVPPK